MATLGDLVVKLSMDAAGFASDAGRAAFVAEKSMTRVVAAGNLAANVITGLAKTFGNMALEAARALPAVADAVAEQVDALNEAADAAGISAVAYQKLQLSMQEAGVSAEQFDAGMKKLSVSIVDAAQDADSKAGVAFQRLGISVKNADGSLKTVDQTISELSARFQTLPAGPEKVAIAVELMGKAGAKWIPALNSDLQELGSQAAAVGAIFSEDLTQAADDYKLALAQLSIAQQGLSNVIAEHMLVPMTEAIKVLGQFVAALTQAANETDKIEATAARDAFRAIAIAAAFTIDVFATLSDMTKTLGESMALLLFAAHQAAEGLNRVAAFDFAAAKQSLRNIDDAIDEFRRNAQERLNREPLRVRLETQFAAADMAAAQRKINEALPKAALRPLPSAHPGAPKAARKGGKSEAEREIDAATKRLDALQRHNAEENARISENASEEQLAIFLKGLDEQARAEERFRKLQEKNAEEATEIARRESKEQLDIWLAQQEEIAALAQSIGQRIKDNFGGPMADALTDAATGARSLGEAFRDMVDNIGEAMTRLAAEQVAQSFTDWLFKGSGTGGSSAFGSILGGIFGGTFGGTFQHGGIFTGNRTIIAGEDGPEVIHAFTGGRVDPIESGNTTTNNVAISVNVPATTDRRTADQIAAQVGTAVGRAMKRIQ